MKIGLLADVHYCTKETVCNGTRFPQLAMQRTKEAVRYFTENKADLIVCLGDLINVDDTQDMNIENLKVAAKALSDTDIPVVCLMGNHDCEAFTREEFETISGLKTAPHDFDAGEYALHFLDANYTDNGEKYVPFQIDWKNSFLPQKELNLIKESVQDKAHRQIYLVHQCLDPFSEINHMIRNATAARALIEQANSPIVLQGHYHKGRQNTHAGVQYLTLPAICSGPVSSALLRDTDDIPALGLPGKD